MTRLSKVACEMKESEHAILTGVVGYVKAKLNQDHKIMLRAIIQSMMWSLILDNATATLPAINTDALT